MIWINLKDAEPKIGYECLVYSEQNGVVRARADHIDKHGIVFDHWKYEINDVSHWMPLPDKPKNNQQ